jgi:hypothetical protein
MIRARNSRLAENRTFRINACSTSQPLSQLSSLQLASAFMVF